MPSVRDLVRASDRGPVLLTGATAAYAAYLGAGLAAARPLVVVVPSDAAARACVDDLALFGCAATILPEPDGSAYAELAADRAAEATRLAVLYALVKGGAAAPRAIVTTGAALVRKTLPVAELAARAVEIRRGQALARDATAARLLEAGFARAPVVDDVGTFAVRGNVLDVGAPGLPYPARIELDGDDVDSIRLFDPGTQRTLREIDALDLHPIRTAVPSSAHDWRAAIRQLADDSQHPSSATRRLIEQLGTGELIGLDVYAPAFHAALAPVAAYLPPDAAWLWWDPDATLAAIDGELAAAAAGHAERRAHKQLAFPPEAHFVERAEVVALLTTARRRVVVPALAIVDDPRGVGADVVAVQIDPLATLRTQLERARVQHDDHLGDPLVRAIAAARADGNVVVLAADSAQRADRLHGLLEGHGVAADRVEGVERVAWVAGAAAAEAVQIVVAPLSRSFASPADGLVAIAAADVFGVKRHAPRTKSASKRAKDALLGGVGDFAQLAPGDFLVHQLHGVGRYRGLAKLPLGGTAIDFLQLEYDGGTLYLPVFRLGEVQRYVGAEGHGPRLDKLGGLTWDKAKTKASRQVAALAEELLQVYAQRATLPGHRFPPPDEMYREFEAAFPYEETPDQLAAIEATAADMESAKAMDRLVCGDVGYGKTEVALRAIMKCALAGKQALLLAPTTILVEQHARTMRERFESWPVRVGKLSRFQTRTEQLATLRALADGHVDVVVGTHRALSPDVRWQDLGLVVIDEEQRFGVAHKERLKKLRAHVDVLTLTATPIPRTLHLALTGMRDLSIIATPPADRRAVRTFVAQVDAALIKGAIEAELARGGQIYFVTRHIDGVGPPDATRATTARADLSLKQWAALLQQLVPRARVGMAHGGLGAEALEDVMVKFVGGELDVLVATTIVESGLDIPRANTLFVARADAFGLSQLYQLRGRVGRSSARAYCYLLVPAPEQLTDEARRRLEALQRFTELGAGFQIASADLEIRGGGELLGARQSGSIAAVGFDQYVRMLEEAVAQLRGEPIHHPVDPELTVDVPGYIPDDYVPDPGQRLDLYKRLSAIEDEDECRALLDELADRFGPVPGETLLLADLMIVKALARRLDATTIELTRVRLAIGLAPSTPVDPKRLPRGWRLDRDGRLHTAFDAEAAKAPTQAARRRLQELGARAT
ncbi:MAG: transcription-repair coupling factor [Myxococcales bacterium]|nr:transcription-repair coupling factor [Myxococcales bacterium]